MPMDRSAKIVFSEVTRRTLAGRADIVIASGGSDNIADAECSDRILGQDGKDALAIFPHPTSAYKPSRAKNDTGAIAYNSVS